MAASHFALRHAPYNGNTGGDRVKLLHAADMLAALDVCGQASEILGLDAVSKLLLRLCGRPVEFRVLVVLDGGKVPGKAPSFS